MIGLMGQKDIVLNLSFRNKGAERSEVEDQRGQRRGVQKGRKGLSLFASILDRIL